MNEEHKVTKNAWVGVVLVAIGGYFLLRNLDMIPSFIPHYLFGWQTIFILIGGSMLATGRRTGFLFLFLGAFFLFPKIFYWPDINMRDWWPLILIIVGLVVLLKRRYEPGHTQSGLVDDDYIDEVSIFGGSEKAITSQNFKGGRITSIFGGSKISFMNSKLSDGENIIDELCLFGGSTLAVPADWTIVNTSLVIFGGYNDKRGLNAQTASDPAKVLRIKGLVIFGGSEITSF